MKSYSREELFELAAAYAIGATSAEESAAIEAALPSSPELAAEVASFRDVAVGIAQQSSATPSANVRAEFLRRVSESKQAAIPAPPRQTEQSFRISIGPAMVLAASIVLAIGFGVRNGQLMTSLEKRQASLDSAMTAAARYHAELNSILTAETNLRIVHLKSADTVAGPGVQFFWNLKDGKAIAHAFRLKPAPAGRAYQIWFLIRGKPVSVKVFNSDPDGHAIVDDLTLPATADGVSDVLITEEPAGGSPGPTTTPFIGGKMPIL